MAETIYDNELGKQVDLLELFIKELETSVLNDLNAKHKQEAKINKGLKLSELIEKYNDVLQITMRAGKRSIGRVTTLRIVFTQFLEFTGDIYVKRINSEILHNYTMSLLNDIADPTKRCGKSYAEIKRTGVRQLIRWAVNMDYLDSLPKNWNDKDLVIGFEEVEDIKFYTNDEIHSLLNNADYQLKLWILLVINCNMAQIDINALTSRTIDWEKKTLTYKRIKTKKSRRVPQVEYPLWDCTYDLLLEYKDREGSLFSRPDGNPLVIHNLNGKTDFIGKEFGKLCTKVGITSDRTFKHLRNTSATKLNNNPIYHQYRRHFLGHKKESIADLHYAAVYQAEFAKAVMWLAEDYGLTALPTQ